MSYYESEFLQNLEKVTNDRIKQLRTMSQEDELRPGLVQDIIDMTKVLNEAAQIDAKERDMERQRENEETRILEEADIEKKKIDPSWKRVSFEMAKAVVPLVISIIGYGVLQGRLFDYESDPEGHFIHSSAGRQFSLPKFWK